MLLPIGLLFSCPLLVTTLSPPTPNKCVENEYRLGDEYVVERCKKYFVDGSTKEWTNVKACLTPLKKRIQIAESVEENGIQYLCARNGVKAKLEKKYVENISMNNLIRSKRQTILCDGQYKNGERFHAGNFINQCTVTGNCWSIVSVGCLTPDRKEIAAGSSAEEKGLLFKCMINGRGLETSNLPTGTQMLARRKFAENQLCDGKYKNGERFKFAHNGNDYVFIAECTSTPTSSTVTIVACLTPEKKVEIPIGFSAKEGGFEYKCIKNEKGVMIFATQILV